MRKNRRKTVVRKTKQNEKTNKIKRYKNERTKRREARREREEKKERRMGEGIIGIGKCEKRQTADKAKRER